MIIGGGIVGLATAWQAIRRYPQLRVTVFEKEAEVGQHQTGHNSGVIHSGLYYAPGSLKARLSVAGAEALIAFCREHRIAHEICGKVVVATDEAELPRLEELYRRGIANGLAGLRMIEPDRLRELEPNAAGLRALHVPGTGIVDFPAVARKLAELIRAAGGQVACSTRVVSGHRANGVWHLETSQGAARAEAIITCGGLQEDRVAASLGTPPSVQIVPFRGEYYALRPERSELIRSLIYPVPDPVFPFLGVHFTRMITGGVEAGPNAVLAFKREGYGRTDFDLHDTLAILATPGFPTFARRHWRAGLQEMHRSWSKGEFVRSLQRLVPALRSEDLTPGGAGVRAQAIAPSGNLVADFQIDEAPGALHVLNAPSPAATASLAVGDYIASKAAAVFGFGAISSG